MISKLALSIKRSDAFRLRQEIHHFRHRGLHPKRQFILLDSSEQFSIRRVLVAGLVQRLSSIDNPSPPNAIHTIGIIQKQHRLSLTPKLNALLNNWQKAIAPKRPSPAGKNTRHENLITRKILIHRSQTVLSPRHISGHRRTCMQSYANAIFSTWLFSFGGTVGTNQLLPSRLFP